MSSDTDDSGVLVENAQTKEESILVSDDEGDSKEETPDEPGPKQALQIVKIGDQDNEYAFSFDKEKWNVILSQIPVGWKVSIVSVVGAFRTGKSFLLSWFLQYLTSLEGKSDNDSSKPWYEQVKDLGNAGFEWKAGSERNTTGIWMWHRPFFIDATAVLLVDTQGLFDNETPMDLTASIFGLSTLLSSYQIYNVDKRIQEDNLQQLALFVEYAKAAMKQDGEENEGQAEDSKAPKPFQMMEFLVRDWQHYEDEEESIEEMEASMRTYLDKVIAERNAKDLADTRAQITSCFEQLDCYGLCHPGFAVTKKKFSGNVDEMEPLFLKLLDSYCQRVFSNAKPKIIHGRELTAVELGSYIEVYAELFAKGTTFPTAATLLEATATANNSNAKQLAISSYADEMDKIAGPRCSSYLKPEELEDHHRMVLMKAMSVFDSVATFGNQDAIEKAKDQVKRDTSKSHEVYVSLNDSRNPLAGLEVYAVPFAVASSARIVRWFVDLFCGHHVCRATSDSLHHAYMVVVVFMLIIAATKYQQIKVQMNRLWTAFSAATNKKVKKD